MENYTNPIEEAKRIARETIGQAHDIAIELDEPTEGMFEFDAIAVDDPDCGVAEIAIMHPPASAGNATRTSPKRPSAESQMSA